MNFEDLTPAEIAPQTELNILQKKREWAQRKWMLAFATLGFLVLGAFGVYDADQELLFITYSGFCLVTIFVVGALIFTKLPVLNEVEHSYAQLMLPGLLAKAGATEVRVGKRHDLAMKTFLEAGLFYDKYSTISREDWIQGKFNAQSFGMYEVALQTVATYGAGPVQNTVGTNRFYGWFIVIPVDRISGFHFITMHYRNNEGESDDWHTLNYQHWVEDRQLQKIILGETKFDDAFMLNTDQPEMLRGVLTPSVQEFLLYVASTTKNSFAISIQRSRIYMMIGHESASFRKCPDKKFTEEIHPEMFEEVKWYADLIRGLSRIKRGGA